jgi:glycosyltransferase involved in cell wall biosynthesis
VRDGLTGLLVPHGDPVALAGAMRRLVDDGSLVERLGTAARRHAEAHSWQAAADRVEAHLRDLAAGVLPPPSFGS